LVWGKITLKLKVSKKEKLVDKNFSQVAPD
jgi:hypothetical protein